MTIAKKLKRSIRARSRKTGESYTAARRHVLLSRGPATSRPPWPVAPPATPTGAGKKPRGVVSNASVLKKTGHGLDHWFALLDAFGAPAQGHTASAAHLNQAHGVPGWHAQMITVEYERARGLRAVNQACSGRFQVSVSRVVPALVAEVTDVFASKRRRAEWLGGADATLARAMDAALDGAKPRRVTLKGANDARLRYPWDGSVVEIRMTTRPSGGASIVVDNSKLANVALVEARRRQWRGALDGLKQYLGR